MTIPPLKIDASRLLTDFPALIWQSGPDGSCNYFNRTWLEFTGRTLEEELGEGWTQGLHPDDLEKTVQSYHEAFRARRPFELEYRLRRHDGEYRDLIDYGQPIADLEGRFAGYLGSCYDVTARKRAEARLVRSEALLAEAQAVARIGSWEWDIQSDVVIWSDELFRMMGLHPRERPISYPYFLSLVHLDDRERVDQIVRQAFCDHQPFEYEYRVALSDGQPRVQFAKGVVITDGQGHPVRLHGTSQDITAQSIAKDALRQSEQRFRQLAENIHEIFWIRNVDPWRMEFVSPAYEQMWKRSLEDLQSRPDAWMDAIHPEDRARVREEAEQLSVKGESDQTYRIVWPDDSIRWIRDRAFPVRDGQGKLVRIAGITEDITERKRTEQQLENFAEMLQILSNRLFEVQEEDRRHLARELHDEIGQSLTAAKLEIEAAKQLEDPAARALRLDDSLAVIEQLLQAVRLMSLDLRPALLDEVGLAAAVRAHVQSHAARGGLAVHLAVDDTLPRCAPAIEIACFRVAQESLTNILRHAQAKTVEVELGRQGDELRLIIRDDGRGFDLAEAQARTASGLNFGLLSMRERVHLAGGRFGCKSAAGQGTRIEVHFSFTVPLMEDRYEKAARHSSG